MPDDAKAEDAKPDITKPEDAKPEDAKPEAAPPAVIIPEPDTGYTSDGVPTLEGVREKIENRYGTALGATELAEETPEGRSAAERYEKMQKAATEKLDEIRASMHKKD